MGNTWWLRSDDVVAFVDASEQHAAEMNRPDAVGNLLESDGMLLEGVGDKQQPLLEADGAGVGHALDDEVPGVLDRWQGAGVLARGWSVARRRGVIVQGLMGPLVVVEVAKGIEGPLLGDEGRAGGANGLALQGLVHALVRPVLLGWAGKMRWC